MHETSIILPNLQCRLLNSEKYLWIVNLQLIKTENAKIMNVMMLLDESGVFCIRLYR